MVSGVRGHFKNIGWPDRRPDAMKCQVANDVVSSDNIVVKILFSLA